MAKGGFNSYNGTQFNTIRGAANIGTDQELVYVAPGHRAYGEQDPGVLQVPSFHRMSPEIDGFWFQNNSGAADMIAGVGLRIDSQHWRAWDWNDGEAAGAKYPTEHTTEARVRGGGTPTTFTILTAADDDGLLIGSRIPWGWLTVDIATANDENMVTLFEYWTSGSAWSVPAATSTLITDWIVATTSGTGETSYVWDPAQDWGRTGDLIDGVAITPPDTGLPGGMYYARIRIDGADVSATGPICNAMELGIHTLVQNVDDESTASRGPNLNFYDPHCDAVVMINSIGVASGNLSYYVTARARG